MTTDKSVLSNDADRVPTAHVIAVVAGNALEFYDFVAYSFFALQIGRTFFPAQSPNSSLLLSLATFGAGFLTRPLGGLVIGRIADRSGRRPAMMLSFTLMGAGMVGLALTPSYRSIGLAAPLIALGMRLLQGFALGGEIGPTTAFLAEAAPASKRGFYTSLQYTTQDVGRFVAGLVGFALASALSPAALDDWGWRAAFLVGAAVVPLGLMIRRTLPETLFAPESVMPLQPSTIGYGRIAVLGFLILASQTVATYVQNDLTTYAQNTLRLSAQAGFAAIMINALCTAGFDPLAGWLSDRFGRKPVLIIGTVLFAAATYPAFLAIVHFGTAVALCVAAGALGILSGIAQPPTLTAITELLPRAVRAGTLAVVYALAISVFGGSTQFIITWLTAATGNPLAPAWYMLAATVVGLLAIARLPESAPHRRPRRTSALGDLNVGSGAE